jgi:flagellar biosynthesis protein FlhG
VLIDADLAHPKIAGLCGVSPANGLDDVLLGRRSIHEALQRGPGGIQVVAGCTTPEAREPFEDRMLSRLLRQIRSLGPHADWLVIDAGSQANAAASRLWSAAERVLLVTSPDAVAVMDSYALVKTLLSPLKFTCPLALIVNFATSPLADDVHQRIDQSCRRFLGLSVDLAAALPTDSTAIAAQSPPSPLALTEGHSLLASAIQQVARMLAETSRPASSKERLSA